MDENKRSHLEMIQGVINRLSQNSFLLKGWSVILISALMTLATKDRNINFILLAYFPALVFWMLDGYFLRQERLFRSLYDNVRKLNGKNIDFSMDTSGAENNVACWFKVTVSRTLIFFHGVIIFSIIIVMLILISQK